MLFTNEFLKPLLLPFINEHHSDGKYKFWSDIARAHYSKETQVWLNGHEWTSHTYSSTLIHQTSSEQDQSRTFRIVWHKRYMREDVRPKQNRSSFSFFEAERNLPNVYRVFNKGAKSKVKYKGQHGHV